MTPAEVRKMQSEFRQKMQAQMDWISVMVTRYDLEG